MPKYEAETKTEILLKTVDAAQCDRFGVDITDNIKEK